MTSLDGGIRIYNQKYVTVSYDLERRVWYLKKEKGGACIAWGAKTIIIATFNSELKNAAKNAQTAGECNKRAETLQKTLVDAGY